MVVFFCVLALTISNVLFCEDQITFTVCVLDDSNELKRMANAIELEFELHENIEIVSCKEEVDFRLGLFARDKKTDLYLQNTFGQIAWKKQIDFGVEPSVLIAELSNYLFKEKTELELANISDDIIQKSIKSREVKEYQRPRDMSFGLSPMFLYAISYFDSDLPAGEIELMAWRIKGWWEIFNYFQLQGFFQEGYADYSLATPDFGESQIGARTGINQTKFELDAIFYFLTSKNIGLGTGLAYGFQNLTYKNQSGNTELLSYFRDRRDHMLGIGVFIKLYLLQKILDLRVYSKFFPVLNNFSYSLQVGGGLRYFLGENIYLESKLSYLKFAENKNSIGQNKHLELLSGLDFGIGIGLKY